MQQWIRKHFAVFAALLAFAAQIFTWFVLYPLAGYTDLTLLAAQLLFLILGIGLLWHGRFHWKAIGLSGQDLLRGAVGIAFAYGLVLIILLAARASGAVGPIFRQQYHWYGLLNNWLLTGFGEELLFAGVLYNAIARNIPSRGRWKAVLLTAGLFGLWHLPGYLAIGMSMGTLGPGILIDLLLPAFSWGFFGAMYLLSGSLWLAVFAHASTDYALLPAITDSPAFGLVFMAAAVLAARRLGPKHADAPSEGTVIGDRSFAGSDR